MIVRRTVPLAVSVGYLGYPSAPRHAVVKLKLMVVPCIMPAREED